MALSYIVYLGLLFFCWLTAYVGDRRDEKRCVRLIIVALTLVAGLRHASVGMDTANYLLKFDYIANGQFEYAYAMETSFKLFCYAVLKVVPSTSFLLAVLAFVTHGCVVARLWELRRVSSFTVSVTCYYMAFFFMSLNAMRQFCAIGILFYATRFLVKRQYLRYVLGTLAASLFHRSALLGLALVVLPVLQEKKLRRYLGWLTVGGVVCLPAVWVVVRPHLERYLSHVKLDVDIGLMVPAKMALFLCTVVIIFVLYGKERWFPEWRWIEKEEQRSVYLACVCYGFGLCVLFASYFIPTLNRVGLYFTVQEGVVIGMLAKNNRSRWRYVFEGAAFFLLSYAFIRSTITNGQDIMPYLFVWQ